MELYIYIEIFLTYCVIIYRLVSNFEPVQIETDEIY